MATFKQVHDSQIAMIAEIQNLQNLVSAFYKLVEKLVDENHATNAIHKDLMSVLRTTSEFMAETPNLLNGIVNMLTAERTNNDDNNVLIKNMNVNFQKMSDNFEMIYKLFQELVDKGE